MRTMISFALVVLFLSALSQLTFAQQSGSSSVPAVQDGAGKGITPESFKDIKARVLTMLEERRTRLDKEKACVETAQNAEELRKCRPERPMGPGGNFQRGQGQQPRSGM